MTTRFARSVPQQQQIKRINFANYTYDSVRNIIIILLTASLFLSPNTVFANRQLATVSNSVPERNVVEWDEENPQSLVASNLYAQSAILINSKTGDIIFSKNPDTPLFPASITKILTCLIVLEQCDDLYEMVVVDLPKLGHLEPTWIPLQNGEQMTVNDLLHGALIRSYNDAAAALAVHVGGSIQGFAELMNEKATMLGCTQSNFTLPHGLNSRVHYTTARDMAIIAKAAMQNETFRSIVSKTDYVIPPSNLRVGSLTIHNGNSMLPGSGSSYSYEGCIGVKTGYTSDAQHTYVAAAERDSVELICVLLGTRGPETMSSRGASKWLDAQKLFEYGFAAGEMPDTATPRSTSSTIDNGNNGGVWDGIGVTATDTAIDDESGEEFDENSVNGVNAAPQTGNGASASARDTTRQDGSIIREHEQVGSNNQNHQNNSNNASNQDSQSTDKSSDRRFPFWYLAFLVLLVPIWMLVYKLVSKVSKKFGWDR